MFFSIRWKLSLALVCLSLGLVGFYVYLAKTTFESDKIAYVFETQQAQLNSLSRNFDQKIEQSRTLAEATLSTFDVATGLLNTMGQKLIAGNDALSAVELWDLDKKISLMKFGPALRRLPAPEEKDRVGSLTLRVLAPSVYLLQASQRTEAGENIKLRWITAMPELLAASPLATTAMVQDGQVLGAEGPLAGRPELTEMAGDFGRERAAGTQMRQVGAAEYLVSSAKARSANVIFISAVEKKQALSGLSLLFRRSLIFLLFSAFVTTFLALLMSGGLTRSLKVLTESATRIGQGDFNHLLGATSHDEIGILDEAFARMGSEIKRLLVETKDKARMELELKTASLVQESLLPQNLNHKLNEFSLTGHYMTSTECGGDWWHYYSRHDDLYVVIADATGHGTPAALVTSCARSVFSTMEHRDLSLSEIMKTWDEAVFSCTGGKVFMTAILLRVNTRTGAAALISASHENPFFLRLDENRQPVPDERDFAPLLQPRLGERHPDPWTSFEFQINPGDRLVLYTDGLTAVESPDGKTISEKRWIKQLSLLSDQNPSSEELARGLANVLERHRQGAALPDDVSFVVVDRRVA